GRKLRGQTGDSLKLRILFKPTAVGQFRDSLIITYSFTKNGPNFKDTVFVKGTGSTPSSIVYQSVPDTLVLTAVRNEADSQYVKIWNGGTLSDSIVVDSVKFKSTHNDSALPFIVRDSSGFVMPDNIGRKILGQFGDTLRLRVLFKPSATGQIKDSLIITYKVGNDITKKRDTIVVRGVGRLKFGDVNKDKSISAADASFVLQYVIGISSAVAYFASDSLLPDVADVTNNGTVSAYDAALILRRGVGIIGSFPADTTQFLKAVPAEFEKIYLAAPVLNSKEANLIRVPLKIRNGKGIYAFDGNLKYDPEFLEFQAMEIKFSKENIISDAAPQNGKLKFAIASGVPLALDGDVVIFVFRIKQRTGKSLLITMPDIALNEQNINPESAAVEASSLPDHYSLNQNYPNPFNPVTVIQFALPEQAYVNLDIYNILGQRVRTLVHTQMPAGYHQFEWNGRNDAGQPVSSGIYIYRLRANKFTDVRKMIFMK
ncbi:MAG: T9SS type A sorting domain-containing protein, partial [Patescibacteria group bacterium]|nr:T9SS type A sorting domain-containing protein [Patescibacteria group bacterium]